jgi:hypothetical protein
MAVGLRRQRMVSLLKRKARFTKSLNWMLWKKEPAMSEFKENKEIERVLKDVVKHGHGFAMVSIEGVEHVSIAHVINPFPCEELGDNFPIENHISTLCEVKDQ